VCFGNYFLSPSYYFVQPRCGHLPYTSLWLFLFYANVSSSRSISIKDNVAKLHDTFVQFLTFFGHKSCWMQLIFMTYFSHFSSPILTFTCLFSTIQFSMIIATISRWSTIESCGPWFWNVGGHVLLEDQKWSLHQPP
jgi:hypothetical protein